MNQTTPPAATPLLKLTGKQVFALCLIVVAIGSWVVLELLADADYPAGQQRFMSVLCIAGSAFTALVTGVLARSIGAALLGWALGLLLGVASHALVVQMQAQSAQELQTARRDAIEHLLRDAAAKREPAALGASMKNLPLSLPGVFCVLADLDRSEAAQAYAPAEPVSTDTLMHLGASMAAAGDRAATLAQRQLALRYLLSVLIDRNEPARLPQWLELWRRNQPGGRADAVELVDNVGWDSPENCPNNTGADELGDVFRAWGIDGLRSWRQAGFRFTARQQYQLLEYVVDAQSLDQLVAAGIDVNASPYPGAGPVAQNALLWHAEQLGQRLAAAEPDMAFAMDLDLIAAFVRHGADLRSRDEHGRDACALLKEGLTSAPERVPVHPQFAQAQALLCRAPANASIKPPAKTPGASPP
ncbi:hypothetical protein [Lysobacter sp. Root690]|uniref:hypothetical protein n=1 Tax=Lysobacter sp. Root690 TaxID=1736588 RepID=UPI0006F876D8|nr:hypothetical protein [Lysobacter sp. Root690]KRB08174.1 hypothetical protein ASD86_10360 [Lysobacter sp. Root690]